MDLSKLPKLSNTGESPSQNPPASALPPNSPPSNAPLDYGSRVAPQPGIGGDVWFNAVVGILCLFVGRMFGSFLIAKLTGQPFHTNVNWTTGDQAGQEVAYSQLEGHQMLCDAGIFLFGLAVLLEALVKALFELRRTVPQGLVLLTLAIAGLTTLINLVATIKLMSEGVIPIMSGIALAFGGYIVMDVYRIFSVIRLPAALPHQPSAATKL